MEQPNRIEWLDRQGRVLGPATDPQPYAWVCLDRSGRWLAASVITPRDGYRDLWLVDLERGTPQRFTDQPGWESTPAWSPDGRRIAFSADWSGPPNVHLKEVGGGPPRELVPFDNSVQYVGSWSSDGRWVLYRSRGQGNGDLWRVDVETLERQPLLETPADETSPRASPDGRWIAFCSDESGRREVYVGTYPDLEGVRRVSNEGGDNPRWKGDSSELYYQTGAGAIVSVVLRETGGLPDPGPEVVVIQPMEDLFTFDVTPDAERFLVVRRSETQIRPVFRLIVGWEGLLE
jgi:Tol biopolymer transport system component